MASKKFHYDDISTARNCKDNSYSFPCCCINHEPNLHTIERILSFPRRLINFSLFTHLGFPSAEQNVLIILRVIGKDSTLDTHWKCGSVLLIVDERWRAALNVLEDLHALLPPLDFVQLLQRDTVLAPENDVTTPTHVTRHDQLQSFYIRQST